MKHLILFMLVVFGSGCATAIPLSYKERCALKDMKLAGVTSGDTHGSSYVYGQGTRHTSESSEDVSCVVPHNEKDVCEINTARSSAEPKLAYNKSLGWKKWLEGLGYCAFIVPGVAAHLVFESQKDDAESASRSIATTEQGKCKFDRKAASE